MTPKVPTMQMRPLIPFALIAWLFPAAAHAGANLVTDGSFSNYTGSTGNFELTDPSNNGYGSLTSWQVGNAGTTGANGAYVTLFNSNNVTGTPAQLAANTSSPSNAASAAKTQYGNTTQYLNAAYNGPSPDGGTFLALDTDPTIAGTVSQTIGGLVAGTMYNLSFYWAVTEFQAIQTPTAAQFQVNFGSASQTTQLVNVAANSFQGWVKQTMFFTANSTSQTLTFLATGSPSGQPGLALLDGVSLTVPEPATWALTTGAILLAAATRRRRKLAIV